jgi:uncharacterized protein YbjT (DUF2867 family)
MKQIILAGGTGDLGSRVARALSSQKIPTRALVREGSSPAAEAELRGLGHAVERVDFGDAASLKKACRDGTCVISCLSGLRPVIVEAQTALLRAAVGAGVPRFIPSDFSIEIPFVPAGSNRNLDLRREFHERLASASIRSTSIYNGAFADMLLGQAPIVLNKFHRVLYWGDADQRMAFTTKDDTAQFTASAAGDDAAPPTLRIAGSRVSARELAATASRVHGREFKLFRAGGVGALAAMIKVARLLTPDNGALYPPWQGMQYLHNMYSGYGDLQPLDNDRYGKRAWQSVEEVLRATS